MAELFEDHGESFLYQNQAIFTQYRDSKIKNPFKKSRDQKPPLTPPPHKTPLYSIALCNI